MEDFTIHDFLKRISAFLAAEYTFENKISKVVINHRQVEGSLIGIEIDLPAIRKLLTVIPGTAETREKIQSFLSSPENVIFKSQIPVHIYPILHSITDTINKQDKNPLIQKLQLLLQALTLAKEIALSTEELPDNSIKQTYINSQDIPKLLQAKEYIDQNVSTPTTLKELSKIVCLNEFKLKKGFKEQFNTTVHNYIVEQRLCTSCIMLKEKTCPISEIAHAIGYQCPSKYIHSFRKKFGVTPGKYRRLVLAA